MKISKKLSSGLGLGLIVIVVGVISYFSGISLSSCSIVDDGEGSTNVVEEATNVVEEATNVVDNTSL